MELPDLKQIIVGAAAKYYRMDSPNTFTKVVLIEDGSIGGAAHNNERYWDMDSDGRIRFLSERREVSVIFDVHSGSKMPVYMSGRHLLHTPTHPTMILEFEIFPKGFAKNWTSYVLRDMIYKYGWSIGDYTYGTPRILSPEMGKITIGRFVSIGPGVAFGLGNHRTDIFTSFPFSTLKNYWPGAPNINDHNSKGPIEIGSDVWIGLGTFITSGVKIGDGAVIAAESVVTKDVEPYSIVGGNTAKLLRYRFDEFTRNRLLEIKWWDWDYDFINDHLDVIMSSDIEALEKICGLRNVRRKADGARKSKK